MAETLIPLEEREEERRPSRVEPPRRSGSWVGKLALVLAVVALAVACLALYRTLPPGEDDPQEPGERAESPTISYRDRELPVLEGVAVNSYVSDGFSVNDRGWLTYEQDGKQAAIGIDVSAYQGEIDWQQVADSGVEFAMIRLGYRGYSQGVIMPDKNFEQNLRGALDAGLEVGVYFFSQAVSVWEDPVGWKVTRAGWSVTAVSTPSTRRTGGVSSTVTGWAVKSALPDFTAI